MSSPTGVSNESVVVHPVLGVLLPDGRHREFGLDHWLGINFSVLSISIETSGNNSTRMGDSGDLSSEEVAFLAWEGRIRVHEHSIEIPSHNMLDLPRSNDVVRVGIG